MLDYVVQITRDATRISPADHERLRSVGFDDQGILADHADRVVVQLHQSRRRCVGSGQGTMKFVGRLYLSSCCWRRVLFGPG